MPSSVRPYKSIGRCLALLMVATPAHAIDRARTRHEHHPPLPFPTASRSDTPGGERDDTGENDRTFDVHRNRSEFFYIRSGSRPSRKNRLIVESSFSYINLTRPEDHV